MPHNHLAKILFLSVFQLFSHMLWSQKTEISGIVKDSLTLTPIEGVVVKALDGKKMLAFATTTKSGSYKLSFATPASQLSLSFQHMAYYAKIQTTSNKSQQLNAGMRTKAVSLREASVKAPDVVVKKDTISYNVSAFKSGSDRSIEDVIKKLPGVKVTDEGQILYQQKPITQLNIEGLNMLGGKYTLATRNLQHKDVNRVEVIENFQPIKQLQGKEPSEKVAMNLKLTEEAKMRLIGSAELGAGYREDQALYHGVVTGMRFNKKFQFLGKLKVNNWGEPLDREVTDFFGEYYSYNIADAMVSGLMTSFPPVAYNRAHKKDDKMGTLNSVIKLSKDDELRVNMDYIRRRDDFRYETTSNYFLGTNNVVINEAQKSGFLKNSIRGAVNYQHNSGKFYINNFTSFEAKNQDNQFDLTSNGNPIGQGTSARLSGLYNRLSLLKRSGKKQYTFNSSISYSDMPENRLTFTNVPDVSGEFSQQAQGKTFSTNNSTFFGYDLGKLSRITLGVALSADYDKVLTQLLRGDSSVLNQNDGYKVTTSVSPSYELLAPDRRRYSLRVNVPVEFLSIDYTNRLNRNADFSINSPFFSPSINGFYQFSAFTKVSASSGMNTNVGDITDFVLNPIQSSYKQYSVKSGILAKTRSLSSSLSFEYKNPLKFFFASGGVSYGNTWRNILGSQTVTAGNSTVGINSSAVADNNTSQNASVSGNVSKDIRSIRSSFSVGARYGISSGQQIRQGVKTEIQGNSFSVSPSMNMQVVKRVELNYQMNYSISRQFSGNYNAAWHQQSHNLKLSYNPVDPVVIYSSLDFNRQELRPDIYKTMQFLDAGVRYKYKKLEAELKLNNLLNTREYSYTVYSNLDRFSYTYYLNPREVVAIVKFSL